MSDPLNPYYDRELYFIRKLADEFAQKFPATASRLKLEPNRSADPHVERLIEAFALLAGRVHHKLDDEFPELTDALLGVLYPHYLAPIPSMAILQFPIDAGRGPLPDGFPIPQHSRISSQPLDGLKCRYRTGYPVTLWPLEVAAARLQPPPYPASLKVPDKTKAALRLQIDCQAGLTFAELSLKRLRLFLHGDDPMTANLYELLFNHTIQVLIRPLDRGATQSPVVLSPRECLFQVGFEREEGLLPYPSPSFPGYRLLTEFFAFPAKFLFLDLGGFDRARDAGYGVSLEMILFLNRSLKALEQSVEASTFCLGCTPIINLFEQTAEGIDLTHSRSEYRVIPDVTAPKGMEVYSVNAVTSTDRATNTSRDFFPFYSYRHGGQHEKARTFWYASRKSSTLDQGTEVYLHLIDLDFQPRRALQETVVVWTTCLNRDLPDKLQSVGERLRFDLEAAAPVQRLRCLRSPTSTLRPPLQRGAHWRLISHLTLNHLSLTDPAAGCEALQEILRLYDFSDKEKGQQRAAVVAHLIEGITSVSTRPVVRRTGGPTASGFARGMEVSLELDEQKYVGTGVFLFAAVLERFLGLYASVNSFTELVARTRQSEGILKRWPPRAGELPLL
jgi:type VI secretion system protein ImpG